VAQATTLKPIEAKVPFLQRVKFVPVERKTASKDADPVTQARANVIAGIEKQLKVLLGELPEPTSFKRKGKDGVEKDVSRDWTPWYSQRGRIWVTEIKYGQKSILLGEDGKPQAVEGGTSEGELANFYMDLKGSILAGELDEPIMKARAGLIGPKNRGS
jgi:hypothetical protein